MLILVGIKHISVNFGMISVDFEDISTVSGCYCSKLAKLWMIFVNFGLVFINFQQILFELCRIFVGLNQN